MSPKRYAGDVEAPDFPTGLDWLNTELPLSLNDLRGKLVVLDFWTYCCINCMHVFPQLRKLELKYAEELAVIGVHSAKFTAEKDSQNLRKAVLRYEIAHPVVNDAEFQVWQQWGVRAWPTLMFIDPAGKIIGKHEGEIDLETFDRVIGEMIAAFDSQGLIDHKPLTFRLEQDIERERLLSFPGKVLADDASDRLFIADSNHNRILVASLEGEIEEVIGNGVPGFIDGGFEKAGIHDPQGMALDGEVLYIADTKNHAIRRVDMAEKAVSTIAGTGQQSRGPREGGRATSTKLGSPWDLALHDGVLYIAMAGFHQLWRLDLESGQIAPHAGSGRERILDGTLAQSALAQPSGLVTDGSRIYFTDSETSAVRSASLDAPGDVATIVGVHLFTFGDEDGTGDDVRLQHPLGIDVHDGHLYVTDTYNNKVKRISPDTRSATTLFGKGRSGHVDGPAHEARFHEPGGLSISGGRIYIADTNNHAIRVADMHTMTVATLVLKGLP